MTTSTSSDQWVLYQYDPNKAAAIAVAVLFILFSIFYALSIIFTARAASINYSRLDAEVQEEKSCEVKTNARKLTIRNTLCVFIPYMLGCTMEIVGYVARAVSSANAKALAPYIIQSVLLLIAPAFYAATIYMIFGRILCAIKCQSLMMISARFGTTFFVIGDVLSFILQAAGGGLMADENSRRTGSNLATAGLALQIAFFAFFMLNELRFTVKVRQVCPIYSKISKQWWFVNITLMLASFLIMIRSIVRLIEFIEGYNGFIISHEYFIYLFDALPMLLVLSLFCFGSFWGNIFKVIVECRKATNLELWLNYRK